MINLTTNLMMYNMGYSAGRCSREKQNPEHLEWGKFNMPPKDYINGYCAALNFYGDNRMKNSTKKLEQLYFNLNIKVDDFTNYDPDDYIEFDDDEPWLFLFIFNNGEFMTGTLDELCDHTIGTIKYFAPVSQTKELVNKKIIVNKTIDNDDLLILAKVMGKGAYKTRPWLHSSGIAYGDGDDKPFWYMPYENNDQFVEVLDFTEKHGYFEVLTQNGCEYTTLDGYKITGSGESFKENIINIAIQVAKYLSEDNNVK